MGGLIGAICGGSLSNKYGRRGALQLCSIAFAAGGALLAFASSKNGMILGRVVSGMASGAAIVVMPLYVHELAPADEKGT